MAKIIMGGYMIRYPLGGNLSWALQYLSGFKDLGHEVYLVEKFVHDDSCFDLFNQTMTNDCTSGIKIVTDLLARFGLENNWCFVGHDDQYYGMSKNEVESLFKEADLYIENGSHEAWNEELCLSQAKTVFIDVDPVLTQINWHYREKKAIPYAVPDFDFYFTIGLNIGKPGNIIPTGDISWKYIFNPVNTKLFTQSLPNHDAPYSTIMNWRSYSAKPKLNGIAYGHKEDEFLKFQDLPSRINIPMEVAISNIPEKKHKELKQLGWKLRHAQDVTYSYEIFQNYLKNVKGEFSCVKNMYAASNSGWFSDKSAAFLASGRPVVLQETGFSDHLPVGEGLFAVNDVTEAKEAIELIEGNYPHHSKKAREIANEYLDTGKVLGHLLNEVNI